MIIITIISLKLLIIIKTLRIYIFNHFYYIFINFIILNNNIIINFINNKIKFKLKSFIKVINLKVNIEYNILRLLIINYKTYIFKEIFN